MEVLRPMKLKMFLVAPQRKNYADLCSGLELLEGTDHLLFILGSCLPPEVPAFVLPHFIGTDFAICLPSGELIPYYLISYIFNV